MLTEPEIHLYKEKIIFVIENDYNWETLLEDIIREIYNKDR